MKIKSLHSNFKLPSKSRDRSGAYDLYMPEAGSANGTVVAEFPLGFAAAIPDGYVGLILPRSGVGARAGLELNNTCGVIDADYRGEWKAFLRCKSPYDTFIWDAGERVLQVLFVPAASFDFELVEELDETERGTGGFGSSGK